MKLYRPIVVWFWELVVGPSVLKVLKHLGQLVQQRQKCTYVSITDFAEFFSEKQVKLITFFQRVKDVIHLARTSDRYQQVYLTSLHRCNTLTRYCYQQWPHSTYSTPHTLWGCTVELASALTAATILADAAVTPTVSEMTYNVSSGTLNHTQPLLNRPQCLPLADRGTTPSLEGSFSVQLPY